MSCQRVKKKLSAYMDGALQPEDQKEIKNHLDNCQDCADELKNLQVVWEALDILPQAERTPYFYTRLKARIESSSRNGKPVWKKQLWVPFAFAAAMFAGLFLGQSVGKGINGNGSKQEILGESYTEDELLDAFNDFPSSSMGNVYLDIVVSE